MIIIGDFEGAIDTLKMAITLIKQSVTAGTESSQVPLCAARLVPRPPQT